MFFTLNTQFLCTSIPWFTSICVNGLWTWQVWSHSADSKGHSTCSRRSFTCFHTGLIWQVTYYTKLKLQCTNQFIFQTVLIMVQDYSVSRHCPLSSILKITCSVKWMRFCPQVKRWGSSYWAGSVRRINFNDCNWNLLFLITQYSRYLPTFSLEDVKRSSLWNVMLCSEN
jgi:hypothetical protein